MGRRIALLIGNTKYDDPHYRELLTPGQNVHDLEHILKDPERGGFEVTTRINTSRSDAERQIHNLFKNKAQDDFIVFYFAGHGLKDSDDALHFAMQDTEYDDIEVTSVPASFVKSCIDKCNSECIVVILDCCFSGAFADIMSGYGRVVLTATNSIQYAWDRNTDETIGEAENSVFTRYLIEGILTGDADGNGDGEITVDELFSYAYERTVKAFPEQAPVKKIHQSAENLVIARNPTLNKLSNDLLAAVVHHHYYVRLGAISALEELLYLYDGQKPLLVDKIQATLKQLASDPNKQVAKQASSILDTYAHRNTTVTSDTKHLTLFISSPDDVVEERKIVQRVVEKLNADSSARIQAQISIVTWDDPNACIAMIADAAPQTKLIQKEILPPSECDIVVTLLWSKLGAPLTVDVVKNDGTKYESGTEWEYEDALNGAKRNSGHPALLLYRSNQPIIRRNERNKHEKIAQFRKVEQFFATLSSPEGSLQGGYRIYNEAGQFATILERNLRAAIRKLVTAVPTQQQQPELEALPETAGPVEIQEVIGPYLNWMMEQHSRLELRGLGGDARLPTIPLEKVYVALKGSRASTYEREQSRELLDAEVNDIIAENGVELSASNLALLMYYAERKAIILNPFMPSLVERDRPGDASSTAGDKMSMVTLGDAFRKERWMAILGDPGSGKTTLARWIVLKLAAAWLEGETSVIVPAYQVDPKVDKTDGSLINIGPTRLPVLLRVSEFSEAYQHARNNLETLSIADFLGKHTWLGQSPNVPKERLNAAIKHYLGLGRVVVILDGMDEITATGQRDDVVRSIEAFIEDWVNTRGNVVSPQEKSFLWNPEVLGEPATTGGNQIIITSRIAGYHAKPLTGHVTHVTIQPMEQVAVEHFCDAWTLAIHQLLNVHGDQEAVQQKADTEATELKKAIFDPLRLRVRELASNPLLVTILALVFRNNQGHLPEQRAELYQRAMEILIEAWRTTGITTLELIYVLSPLAARIHQLYSTGLIEESEMIEIITGELAKFRQLDVLDLPPAFDLAVDDFVRRIREDVGILSERSEHLFGFLHLTFQEYLAALFLIRDKKNAPQAVVGKLDDPRWREPILMALGHISMNAKWGPEARRHLLTTLLDADDPLSELIPRSALLIVSAIPEMARVPEDVVKEIIRRLMTTYADRDGIGQFATLRAHISSSLKNLYNSKHRELLERFLAESLLTISKGERNMALASATLIAENKWYSAALTKALIKAFPYDDVGWEYPITRTLQTMALLSPEVALIPIKPEIGEKDRQELEKLEKTITSIKTGTIAEELEKRGAEAEDELAVLRSGATLVSVEAEKNQILDRYHEQLASYHSKMADYAKVVHEQRRDLPVEADTLPFRKTLEEEPALVAYIENNLPWLRLVVLLYGGISDHGLAFYAKRDAEIASIFTAEKNQRLRYLAQIREQAYWQEKWDKDDVLYNLAVFLDTENGKILDAAQRYVPRFTPLAIFNDSPLTTLLLNALRQKKHPEQLKERLWHEWRTGSQEVLRAHALLVLLVIDTQVALEALTQSLKDPTTLTLANLVLNHLRVRKHTLADALVLLGQKAEIGQALLPLNNTLATDQWSDLVEVFYRTFTSVMPFPLDHRKELLDYAPVIPYVNAEVWAYWLSGLGSEDPFYSFAVILDTLGKKLQAAPALVNMHRAHNRKYDKFTTWHPLVIPPVYDNDADVAGEALTVAQQSGSEIMKSLFYIGTMTFAWINYPEHPGLKEDALAAALLIPFEFQKDVIKDLDAELAEMPSYEGAIIERVLSIADAVIRARALWRIVHYRRFWNNLNLWDLAIQAAEQVSEPLHRSRAFERLIDVVARKQREHIKTEALEAARKISDLNNQARALVRLALYESNEKRWLHLADALAASEKITDEQQQLETLQLLYPYIVEHYQLKQVYEKIINRVKNEWYWHKGHNVLSLLLLAQHERLHEAQKLTPVILTALIDDVVDLKSQSAGSEDLWSQLLEPALRENAVAALLKTASACGLEGLYLTPKVFDVIQSLLDTREISAIYILLPYMRGAESSLVPALNVWVEQAPDPMVWTYAGLWLAELGQVDMNTIPCLIDLLKHGIDLGRYRASLVLHGSAVFINKVNRDYRTSQLGLDALLLLVQAQNQLRLEKAPIATPINWTWYNITYDDPLVFHQLVQYFNAEEDEAYYRCLLSSISYCDSDTLEALVTEFENGSEKIQKLLLYSWLDLLKYHFWKKITPEQLKRVEEAAKTFTLETIASVKFIPNRHKTLTTVLCSVSEQIEEKKITLQEATFVLNQETAAQARGLPEATIDELSNYVGYRIGEDPQYALEAAQVVSGNSTALELLFLWLAACLHENIDDIPATYNRTCTLLELAAAATRFSPAAIYNLIEKHELGLYLVQATLYHKTAWGRAAAATLLGYLRQTPELFDEALLSGLQDTALVQTAIMQMVQNLRYLDERLIPKMMEFLKHESASVVYAMAKLLASIVRHGKISLELRQEIVKTLSATIQQKNSARPVFILQEADAHIYIRLIGQLDQQLYAAIVDITGVL